MSNSRSVYSTDKGRLCYDCGESNSKCRCKIMYLVPSGDGIIRISREKKGRKGKGVTLLTGFLLPEPELKNLATKLKQICGTGGTIKSGVIEIQGDQREKLQSYLQQQGYKIKLAGG